tara:strand:- start:44 stop:370 length:327 start_codon:yes stop_codon:yes gene_type:complete
MALTKVVTEDKIEIVGVQKTIQVQTKTEILDDGVSISESLHRHILTCVRTVTNIATDDMGDSEDEQTYTMTYIHNDTDVSGESAEVQAIAAALWTDEVKALSRLQNES